ncbi:MAG: Fic family protein [Nanoarchaeota archaeon]|nr:Fic family protein [Nanoarchaeota archaeon]MBU1703741.1 Fic family protein [Nanoarchaeota archaeon]
MVSIVTKKIKNNEYLYLVDSVRDKDRVIQKTIKYLGKKRPVLKEEFDCMKFSYGGRDWVLTDFKDELSYQDHHALKKASDSYKQYLKSLDKVSKEKEKERFLSVFVSHSNAIEGSTLTVKDTYNYLFQDTVPGGYSKKELFMASNLLGAWNYLEKNCNRLPTSHDLFELHALVNRNIESEETLGKYKGVQNYIGDIYTSSYLFVDEKMAKLLDWIKRAYHKIDNFEVAFQSHAQFEIIHPFVDGNGRVGRLLMNWLLMYKGIVPFAVHISKRNDYLSALNNSRKGKIEAICRFCLREYLEQYHFM